MIPPEPLPGVLPWFLAFWELSTDRHYAGGPIPHSAIASWPVDPSEKKAFAEAMRAADAAYLGFIAKPAEERGPTALASPSAIRGKNG